MVESDEGSVTNFIISRNKGGLFIDPRERERQRDREKNDETLS